MSSETQQSVELQRSVRIGRLLIVGAIAGAVVGALVTTLYKVPEGALYSIGQIAGFMLIIGGAVGLTLGGLLALILTAAAKRKRGTAVLEHTVVVDEGLEPAADEAASTDEAAAGTVTDVPAEQPSDSGSAEKTEEERG
ncbi:hypothetical protein [Leucobacter aridicollis]|uniref:hypothetical protein n=1 Tax=Leucobacter aridicollis TaxID=283878 RepID=UPI002102FF3C|nr:hypothetical protein [Leucobacter aridicollis]UTX53616.1 hypothetical protein KI794_02375 [Leucobacter aridicollis]